MPTARLVAASSQVTQWRKAKQTNVTEQTNPNKQMQTNKQNNFSFYAYSPYGGGILTGAFSINHTVGKSQANETKETNATSYAWFFKILKKSPMKSFKSDQRAAISGGFCIFLIIIIMYVI